MKKKTSKNTLKWDSKKYFQVAVMQAKEKEYDTLVRKVLTAKTLSRKDAELFLEHYLRHLYYQLHDFDDVRQKEKELNQIIRETYRKKQ